MISGRKPAILGVVHLSKDHQQCSSGGLSVGVKSEKLPFTMPSTEMLVEMLSLMEFRLAWATVSLGRRMEG